MNALLTSTLKPGLLVSLKTAIRGNVTYATTELEAEHITPEGEKRARWETLKQIEDPDEHDRATKARTKARGYVTAVCAQTEHGLLCPTDRAGKLEAAIMSARTVADDFNRTARNSMLRVTIVCGRIATDDMEAIRAINSEVRDLLEQMQRGVRALDPQAIRDAADKAKSIGAMLEPSAQESVQRAIEAARSAARQIVKAGEGASIEVDKRALARLSEARVAFLDLSDATDIVEPVAAAARAVDFDPNEPLGEADAWSDAAADDAAADAYSDEPARDEEAAAPPAAPQMLLEF